MNRIFCSFLLFVTTVAAADDVTPYDLSVEHLPIPVLGVDRRLPRFSWRVNARQASYRIVVTSSASGDVVWDTDEVASSTTTLVRYGGTPLTADTRYDFFVTSTDYDGSSSSARGSFRTGLFSGKEKLADDTEWITGGDDKKLLRTTFAVDDAVEDAVVYVSGIGYFELYCDGQKVGDHRLDSGWTDYKRRVLYSTFDVTACLQKNQHEDHVFAVMLGNGWFASAGGQPGSQASPPQLLLQANIATKTKGVLVVNSNAASWKVARGPITYDSLYNGETYDARLEVDGWKMPGFDDSQWTSATVATGNVGALASQSFEPIRAISELTPINVTEPKQGMFVVDFGQNIAGLLRITVRNATRGQNVTLKHSELLMHPPYGEHDGTLYYGNLRSAKATDVYTCRGGGPAETYEPTFTQHGFRYAEITGLAAGTTTADVAKDVVAIEMHSDLRQTGHFTTSHWLLNQIQHNTVWGQKDNLMSVPTDCDQRDERRGWMGDAALTVEEATYNFATAAFYTAWLNQLRDDQGDSGFAVNYVPDVDSSLNPGAPNWQSAYPTIVWALYRYHGDVGIVADHWPAMIQYFKYWKGEFAKNGAANFDSGFGDWVPAGPKSDGHLVGMFAYLHDLTLLEELANFAMNDTATLRDVRDQLDKAGKAFHSQFYDKEGYYGSNLQTENAMALWLGDVVIPDEETLEKVLASTIADVEKNAYHPTTGIIGIKMLFEAMSKLGRADIPVLMSLVETYPSYGYMITNKWEPATTLWELWNSDTQGPGMNSRNHIMFGSISSWFYRYLCGIDTPKGSRGYDDIVFAPRGVGTPGAEGLTSVECSVLTPHGTAYASWTGPAVPSNSTRTPTTCDVEPESSSVLLDCVGGKITNVTAAVYGATAAPGTACPHPSVSSKNCSADVTAMVSSLCLGQETCQVECDGDTCAGNTLPGGDPCYGTKKSLVVSVSCSAPPSPPSPTPAPTSTTVQLNVTIPFGSKASVRVPLVPAVGHTTSNVVVREGGGTVVWQSGAFVPGAVSALISAAADGKDGIIFDTETAGSLSFTVDLA